MMVDPPQSEIIPLLGYRRVVDSVTEEYIKILEAELAVRRQSAEALAQILEVITTKPSQDVPPKIVSIIDEYVDNKLDEPGLVVVLPNELDSEGK